MEQEEILLKAENLQVAIRNDGEILYPVNQINLEIPHKTVVGLVGESGCGKSMTAKAVMGLMERGTTISNGHVIFEKEEISSYSPKQIQKIIGNRISMIFQDPMTSLNPTMRIGKQIEEVLYLHTTLNKKERREKVIDMLRKVGVPDPEERYWAYPHQLSGGLRQRVVIAMAMVCEPELLIADEPTTALDVTIENQILQLMYQLKETHNTSILMITHNLGIVSEFCDFVNIMYLGEIVESADVDTIFDKTLHPYTRGLIACVPSISKVREKLVNIRGIVPDLRHIPDGCRFSARCHFANEKCKSEHPDLVEVKKGHKVRCFRYCELQNEMVE